MTRHYMRDVRSGDVFTTENPQYHQGAERLPAKEGRAAYVAQTATELRAMFEGEERPTVYCVLRDVSRSGMSRRISFFVLRNNRPRCIDHAVSTLISSASEGRKDGLTVTGCGMDMGFHVVSCLSRALYRDHDRPDYVLSHEWL